MNIYLVPDWKSAWKWSSVHMVVLAGSVKLVFLGWPELATLLPAWITQVVAVFAFLGLILAARITTTEPTNVQSPPAA